MTTQTIITILHTQHINDDMYNTDAESHSHTNA